MKQSKKEVSKELVRDTLADHFPEVERLNVRRYLNDNLKELYKEVEDECAKFKENVFMKQVNNLEEYMVIFKLMF
jgi:hypothetical protein